MSSSVASILAIGEVDSASGRISHMITLANALINEAVPKPSVSRPYPPAPEGNGVVKEPTVTPRTRRIVHLNTHTTHPIHSEEDIDLYLQRLKEQLMQYIGGGNDIIVS